ncbi:MAG: hypothetical protein S4CHLAM45_02880 [Chlamydiales bacterium]|nr:hypothetical protein [Chlamydiales bacterium]MCH9619146.1 hypothetical protein [Chlamydiales bacterium]MCH9622408.1 hypothetical protein [Chlamydiales bacterium]
MKIQSDSGGTKHTHSVSPPANKTTQNTYKKGFKSISILEKVLGSALRGIGSGVLKTITFFPNLIRQAVQSVHSNKTQSIEPESKDLENKYDPEE